MSKRTAQRIHRDRKKRVMAYRDPYMRTYIATGICILICRYSVYKAVYTAPGRRSLRSTERGVLRSILPAQLLSRIAPSQWLAPPSGMGCLWRCDCIPESTLNLSILASKLSFSVVLGSGALLSSNLEGALYKTS